MNGNRIIAHTIIKCANGYLVTKRSKNEVPYPEYWDIPGGIGEYGELPRETAIRETKEEIGLDIIPTKVIHEDSELDKNKGLVYIRLVYLCELKSDIKNIALQEDEHSEYRFIKSLADLGNDNVVPFLEDVFKNL